MENQSFYYAYLGGNTESSGNYKDKDFGSIIKSNF